MRERNLAHFHERNITQHAGPHGFRCDVIAGFSVMHRWLITSNFFEKSRRDAMFIVVAVEKNSSPVGTQCGHCAPNGAWNSIGNGYYKHCAPTELTSQKHAIESLRIRRLRSTSLAIPCSLRLCGESLLTLNTQLPAARISA